MRHLLSLLGVVWLTWTNPCFESQMPYSPNASVEPCTDLEWIGLYAWEQCDPSIRTDCRWVRVDSVFVRGMECQPMTRSVYLTSSRPHSMVAIAFDRHGNGLFWPARVVGVQIGE